MFRARGAPNFAPIALATTLTFIRTICTGIRFLGGARCRDTPRFVEEPSLRVSEGCELGGGCHRSVENQPAGVESKPATLR